MRPATAGAPADWLDRAAPDLVRSYAAALLRAATAIAEVGRRLVALAAGAAGSVRWAGTAADAARSAHLRQELALEQAAAILRRAAAVLADVATAVEVARLRRARAVAAAESYGLRLDAGSLEPAAGSLGSVTGSLDPQLCLGVDAAALGAQARRAAADAAAADTAAARSLAALAGELRAVGGRPVPALALDLVAAPQAGQLSALGLLDRRALPLATVLHDLRRLAADRDPWAVRAYLLSLPPARRSHLARTNPALIGPLDGAPPGLRYAANRRLLVTAQASAAAAGDTLRARTLATLLTDPARQFLLVDPRGDGQVVEVLGDLSHARHVAVLVPGINNTLDDYPTHLAPRAADLQRAADAHAPGEVATVAWLGYDTPGYLDAPLPLRAATGSRRLVRTVRGLLLHRDVTTTVIGHSYGSLVVGDALRRGLAPDNVVVAGSPGMGVPSVRELGVPSRTRVYALRAPFDEVSWSENFGRDPSDPRFGAVRLATADGSGVGPLGHGGYFDPGTESLRNIARVVTGDRAALTVRHAGRLELAADLASDATSQVTAFRFLPSSPAGPADHLLVRLGDPDLLRDVAGDEMAALRALPLPGL